MYEEFTEELKSAKGYYVYGWVNVDWGGVYFYVGKGKGGRAFVKHNRGKAFEAIVRNFECFPVLLCDGLTEDEAYRKEYEIKQEFIFNRGYPIMDGEGKHGLKAMSIKLAKDTKRQNDPNFREGRPKIEIPRLEEYRKLHEEGEMSVKDICSELGISRRTWYNRIAEAL